MRQAFIARFTTIAAINEWVNDWAINIPGYELKNHEMPIGNECKEFCTYLTTMRFFYIGQMRVPPKVPKNS